MTDIDFNDDPVLALAAAGLELAKAVRAAPTPIVNVAVPDQLAPVVNVTVPEPSVVMAQPPEVRVAVPEQQAPVVNVPSVQEVRIVGLPTRKAIIRRGLTGLIEAIEE